MTDAERAIRMPNAQCGAGSAHLFPTRIFRRQVPIRHYIADFASHPAKLVIEVDGGQHATEDDAPRSAIIEAEGYRVIRFWNNEVLGNPDGVWSAIDLALQGHHPRPASSGLLATGKQRLCRGHNRPIDPIEGEEL